MKDTIELPCRYPNDRNWLERVGDESSKRYILHTQYAFRIGFKEDAPDEYTFIDPSGGPFISIGSTVEGNTVKSIVKEDVGFVIEFE